MGIIRKQGQDMLNILQFAEQFQTNVFPVPKGNGTPVEKY